MQPSNSPTASAPASEEIQRLRRAVFEDENNLLLNRSIEHLFNVSPVAAGDNVWTLPRYDGPADFTYEYDGEVHPAHDVIENTFTDALIVIRNGRVAMEEYANFAREDTRLLSFSMGKILNAVLVGLAIADGAIQSVDDEMTKYLPEFRGTDWDGTTLRHMLLFRTGMEWDDYPYKPGEARDSHENSFIRTVAHYHAPARNLRRAHPPGKVFNYSSLETSLMGALLENALGERLNGYFSRRLWQPAGMEAEAFWVLDGDPEMGGREITGGTFNAVLRDYGRVALMLAQGGKANGKQILPQAWVEDMMRPGGTETFEMNPGHNYGYQTWTIDGTKAIASIGSGGQFLYADPESDTAIVKMSHAPQAYPDFKPSAEETQAFLLAASAWQPR
ncbi:serine hydrolase domain-containing protein [Aurantiacibacter flavus]|uniref:Serine hydrolase domain-containing protein n=1 Tax=Aurantiacibacter flavus TaxID=3145232 RepID=A0ABV0CY38_9SPHN